MLYLGSRPETTAVYGKIRNLRDRVPCCKALTKECMACAAGMLVHKFCEQHPGRYRCPETTTVPVAPVPTTTVALAPADANICCQLDTPLCKACHQGISVDEYLQSKFPPISPTEKKQLDRWYRKMQSIGVPIPKLNQHDSILDIGANVGVFSKTARRICPKCHIYAFEAVPLFASYIKTKNFGNIDVYPFGLSDENGKATFWMAKDGNFGWNTMIGKNRKGMKKVKTEFKIFDDLNIDIPKLQLIKIDTEGAEYKVLRGLNNVIRKQKPTLLVEFGFGKSHPNYDDEIAEFDKLIAMGYTCDRNYRDVRGTTDLRFTPTVATVTTVAPVTAPLKIMIGIPTYNRIGYTKFHAQVIRKYHDIPSSDLHIFDDCSTEYGEKELREWYGQSINFFPCKKRLKSDANIRRMFEYFLTTDFDVIFSLDTDLLFQKGWNKFIEENIDKYDGVLSLYHSDAPHHKTVNCNNNICEKRSMGSAGVVMKRDVVRTMLQENKNRAFDWGFVSVFKKLNIRMMVPKNSLIMHFGQFGQNNACGTKEVAKGFDRRDLPSWIKLRLFFYFDKCKKPTTIYQPRKYLLFTSAGDKSNVQQWISDDRLYDIHVVYYGDKTFDLKVDKLYKRKDTKFPNLLWSKLDLSKYSAVAVWDDDIVASPRDINSLFTEMIENKVDVFSPCHTRGFKKCLFKANPNGIRDIEFIEMNAPMFEPSFLTRFMKNFDPIIKGWGTDIWFSHVCSTNKTCRIAVTDNTCVTNPKTRSDGTREINKAQPEHIRAGTYVKYARKHGLPTTDPKSTNILGYDSKSYMYVVSLQGVKGAHSDNNGRLDKFKEKWKVVCGTSPKIHVCPGIVDKRRGYGLTKAYTKCLQVALDRGNEHPIFLEDDARLVNTDLCEEYNWSNVPTDAFLVMLGGHDWKYGTNVGNYKRVKFSYGTYGFMVPKKNLKYLIKKWSEDLNANTEMISPDVSWHEHAKTVNKHVYAISPLLIWHSSGFSNTWNRNRPAIGKPLFTSVTISGKQIQYRTPLMRSSDIVVGVLSYDKKKRQLIRDYYDENIYFIVGKKNGTFDTDEFDTYKDIIMLDEEESYLSEDTILPYKTQVFFHAVHSNVESYQYVLKIDDDSLVNFDSLRKALTRVKPDYWGNVWHNSVVIRDSKSKWFVSKSTYPEDHYPDYCSGGGYVLSRKTIDCVVQKLADLTFMPNEDVSTGILAKQCQISATHTNKIKAVRSRSGSDFIISHYHKWESEDQEPQVPQGVFETCLKDIEKRLIDVFKPLITSKNVLLVDPAYHGNVGDNLLNYGEAVLLYKLNKKHTDCHVHQSTRGKPCSQKYSQFSSALWQAGGNWGDLWKPLQDKRIKSFEALSKHSVSTVGMPQSYHYESQPTALRDATIIENLVKRGFNLTLTWRQENSYQTAKSLYPSVNNILTPDIAFLIGRIKDTDIYTKSNIPKVDILFAMRNDKESVIGSHREIRTQLSTLLKDYDVSYKVVDWVDRQSYYNGVDKYPMQKVPTSGLFSYQKRFASAVAMYSTAKLIVTDRLHGSIFAFLMNKPHIYIDQMYKKISKTREVTFRNSTSCQNKELLKYDSALSLDDAVQKSITALGIKRTI